MYTVEHILYSLVDHRYTVIRADRGKIFPEKSPENRLISPIGSPSKGSDYCTLKTSTAFGDSRNVRRRTGNGDQYMVTKYKVTKYKVTRRAVLGPTNLLKVRDPLRSLTTYSPYDMEYDISVDLIKF